MARVKMQDDKGNTVACHEGEAALFQSRGYKVVEKLPDNETDEVTGDTGHAFKKVPRVKMQKPAVGDKKGDIVLVRDGDEGFYAGQGYEFVEHIDEDGDDEDTVADMAAGDVKGEPLTEAEKKKSKAERRSTRKATREAERKARAAGDAEAKPKVAAGDVVKMEAVDPGSTFGDA